jgi:hypothetical protein
LGRGFEGEVLAGCSVYISVAAIVMFLLTSAKVPKQLLHVLQCAETLSYSSVVSVVQLYTTMHVLN